MQRLLDEWGLPELKEKFAEEEVTLATLLSIDEQHDKHLPEILPKVGPRIIFKSCLKQWKLEQKELITKTQFNSTALSTSVKGFNLSNTNTTNTLEPTTSYKKCAQINESKSSQSKEYQSANSKNTAEQSFNRDCEGSKLNLQLNQTISSQNVKDKNEVHKNESFGCSRSDMKCLSTSSKSSSAQKQPKTSLTEENIQDGCTKLKLKIKPINHENIKRNSQTKTELPSTSNSNLIAKGKVSGAAQDKMEKSEEKSETHSNSTLKTSLRVPTLSLARLHSNDPDKEFWGTDVKVKEKSNLNSMRQSDGSEMLSIKIENATARLLQEQANQLCKRKAVVLLERSFSVNKPLKPVKTSSQSEEPPSKTRRIELNALSEPPNEESEHLNSFSANAVRENKQNKNKKTQNENSKQKILKNSEDSKSQDIKKLENCKENQSQQLPLKTCYPVAKTNNSIAEQSALVSNKNHLMKSSEDSDFKKENSKAQKLTKRRKTVHFDNLVELNMRGSTEEKSSLVVDKNIDNINEKENLNSKAQKPIKIRLRRSTSSKSPTDNDSEEGQEIWQTETEFNELKKMENLQLNQKSNKDETHKQPIEQQQQQKDDNMDLDDFILECEADNADNQIINNHNATEEKGSIMLASLTNKESALRLHAAEDSPTTQNKSRNQSKDKCQTKLTQNISSDQTFQQTEQQTNEPAKKPFIQILEVINIPAQSIVNSSVAIDDDKIIPETTTIPHQQNSETLEPIACSSNSLQTKIQSKVKVLHPFKKSCLKKVNGSQNEKNLVSTAAIESENQNLNSHITGVEKVFEFTEDDLQPKKESNNKIKALSRSTVVEKPLSKSQQEYLNGMTLNIHKKQIILNDEQQLENIGQPAITEQQNVVSKTNEDTSRIIIGNGNQPEVAASCTTSELEKNNLKDSLNNETEGLPMLPLRKVFSLKEILTVDDLKVEEILRSTHDGRWVLKYQRRNSFLENEVRRDLVNLLIDAVHKTDVRETRKLKELFARFAQEIKEIFPNERVDQYWCPEKKTKGKLWNRFKYSAKHCKEVG